MNIKDFNLVINKYDSMLADANRQIVLLSAVNEELTKELEELKKQMDNKDK
ncbi:hypothetical protein JK635_01815 [Neobacillus sp. YIM B02564]|uniref:Uncharacterized protein n=1 Tax=Neobacillus paridis TaxID=2803862 RepID=A0ABS1TI28_9BACI|nr:hypothetical protein [Neobacillus paridis]MBL4950975.1 hypothetical protein [Neobacillus paridis]